MDQFKLPWRRSGGDLLRFFRDERWEHIVLSEVLVVWVEDSLDFDVSEGAVEVQGEVDVSCCAWALTGRNDDICLSSFQLEASCVFPLTLDR